MRDCDFGFERQKLGWVGGGDLHFDFNFDFPPTLGPGPEAQGALYQPSNQASSFSCGGGVLHLDIL